MHLPGLNPCIATPRHTPRHLLPSRFRRNIGKIPAVTQILASNIECVLPLDAANKQLVMPEPMSQSSNNIGALGRVVGARPGLGFGVQGPGPGG